MGNDKIIFVTGGAGFIGSNYLNKWVTVHKDYLFVNIDSLTYAGDLNNIKVSQHQNYVFEKLDIRDIKKLKYIFKRYLPTGVINFGAETHVDISIASPHIFIETNITGTHNLLALAKEYGVRKFLHISTDEVYGSLKNKKGYFTEKSNLAPNNPYSASKASADLLVRSYHKTFGLDTTITRSSNNYGPNQDSSKLIPCFITHILKGEKVPLYSRGEHIRSWIYVGDNINAIDLIFHKGRAGEIYNICSNYELSNLSVTKKILKLTGKDETSIAYVKDRPGHDFRYALDTTKIKKELGWSPKVSFDEGLKRTLEFFLENQKFLDGKIPNH